MCKLPRQLPSFGEDMVGVDRLDANSIPLQGIRNPNVGHLSDNWVMPRVNNFSS